MKANNSRIANFGVILLTASLSLVLGCTLKPYLVVWNNTGGPVTLKIEEQVRTLQAGASAQFRFPGNTMEFAIETASKQVWRYKAKYPEKSYISKNRIYVQIEQNGDIYVRRPDSSGVVRNLPPQPTGFPLKPEQAPSND